MSTPDKDTNTDATFLQSLGLKHANDAAKILQTLLQQNIVSTQQLKFIQKQQQNEKRKKKNKSNDKTNNTNRYMTRHIALRFHYDGATYNGLAQNVNTPTDNSVEKALFAALQKTCLIESRKTCGYSRSGRTDKGVSAFGQVVALRVRSAFPIGTLLDNSACNEISGSDGEMSIMQETDLPKNHLNSISCWVPRKNKKSKKGSMDTSTSTDDSDATSKLMKKDLSERDFARIINSVLPNSIRILGWSPVTDEFSARFSTKSRTYRYFFVRRDLDLDAMTKGLEYMKGRHDFRNLCKMNCEEVDNFERIVNYAKIVTSTTCTFTSGSSDNNSSYEDYKPTDEPASVSSAEDSIDLNRQICYFEIQGQAFLWHQIRCIASVLFTIGQKLEPPDVVLDLFDIEKNPGKPSYPFAVDLPLLVLHRCEYQNLRFGHSIQNIWRTSCDLECKWEELTLAAERLKNGMLSIRSEAEVHKDDVLEFVRLILSEKRKKEQKRKDLFQTSTEKEFPEPKCDSNGVITWNNILL